MVRRHFTPWHDRGWLLVDVAFTLVDGGEAITDIDVLRHQGRGARSGSLAAPLCVAHPG